MLGKIYNNPRRFAELLEKVLDELRNDAGLEDEIRKRKAIFIEDIMRGLKLAQVYDKQARQMIADPVNTFDQLYNCDLDILEAYSLAIDKRNCEYMKQQLAQFNAGAL